MEIFFIAATILYFFLHMFLLKGLNRSILLRKKDVGIFPKVSVIVACKNEEKNIANCILSLSQLNYPSESIEIILVNDNSTDNTLHLMTDTIKDDSRFRIISTELNSSPNLKGKANAIDAAVKLCTGQIILCTDADCEVPQYWVRETVKYYSEQTAMVCGFTMIKFEGSLFAKLQCLDWIYLLTLASSSSGLKMILSCVGNNLTFSKNSYEKVGGYERINFSVTEDLALMRNINANKNFQIKFPVNKKCLVRSLPCESISELFSQKRRWFRGGIGINFFGYIMGFELYTLNFFLILGLFFTDPKLYYILLIIKTFSELVLLYKTIDKFDLKRLYKYYPLFIFYFALYSLILPWSFLFGKKINWKGQKL
ncbi:MAG: glycosyltransferase [Ignavibacteria bacterium]